MQAPRSDILRISEIFFSLQGETSRVGLPTVFVRLTGCPLRCQYCDTAYAFSGGGNMTISTILDRISDFKPKYVTVTGGEPLAQRSCHVLLTALCDVGYTVSLETSGALDISQVDSRVCRVMDIKTPSSGELDKNCWANLNYLTSQDELKFVLGNEADYKWAVDITRTRCLDLVCPVLFSPVYGELDPKNMATWILRDQLPVRMQVQLHKLLWGEKPGH